MNRIGLWVVVLAPLLTSSLVAQEKDEEERLVWRAFDPRFTKEFFQEMVTDTTQNMKVMGMDVKQTQSQTFLVRWQPQRKDREQNFLVDYEVVRVKMRMDIGGSVIDHDSDNPKGAGPLGEFFNALVQAKLRLTIGPRLEVKDIGGHEELLKRLAGAAPAMKSVLEGILSRDALIQMADSALLPFPTVPVKKGTTWKRDSDLKLGAIGVFSQKFTFAYEGKEDGLDKISFVSTLKFTAPQDAPGLPFKIKKADFREAGGKGFALFDRKLGRFTRVESTGIMNGEMVIDIGGMETTVELRQTQNVRSTLTDKRP